MDTYYDEALGQDSKFILRGKQTRREHYWICAVEKTTGTPIVDGPYDTEDDAQQMGYTKLRGEAFEVIPMRTIDRNRATAIWRHTRVERSGHLLEALKRTRHKL